MSKQDSLPGQKVEKRIHLAELAWVILFTLLFAMVLAAANIELPSSDGKERYLLQTLLNGLF